MLFSIIKSKTLPFGRCHIYYVCKPNKHTYYSFISCGLLSHQKNKGILKAAKKIGLKDEPLPTRLIEPKRTKSGRSIKPPKRFRESQPTVVKRKLPRNDEEAPISKDNELDQSNTTSPSTLEPTSTDCKKKHKTLTFIHYEYSASIIDTMQPSTPVPTQLNDNDLDQFNTTSISTNEQTSTDGKKKRKPHHCYALRIFSVNDRN